MRTLEDEQKKIAANGVLKWKQSTCSQAINIWKLHTSKTINCPVCSEEYQEPVSSVMSAQS